MATAQRLAELFGDPQIAGWWWPGPTTDTEPPSNADSSPEPESPEDRTGHAKAPWRRLLIVVAVAALIVAVIVLINHRNSSTTNDPAASSPAPAVVGNGTSARLTAPVDGSMTAGHHDAKTITLWSLPSTSSGCDISPCQPGTDQAGTVTLPVTVVVMCVTAGQQIRNGAPGDDGFYRDNRWLRLAPGQNFGQTNQDQALWLSNVWFLRDRLPDQLPSC